MRVGINVQAGTIEVDLEGGVAIQKIGDDFNINPLNAPKSSGVTQEEIDGIIRCCKQSWSVEIDAHRKALKDALDRIKDLEVEPDENSPSAMIHHTMSSALGRVSSLETSRKEDVSKALSTTALLTRVVQSHDALVARVEMLIAGQVKNAEDIDSLLNIIAEVTGLKIEREGQDISAPAPIEAPAPAPKKRPTADDAPDPFSMVFAELKKRLPADAAIFYKKILQQTYRQGLETGVVMLNWNMLTKMCGKSRETARKRLIAFSNMGLMKREDELGKGGPEKQVKLKISGWNNARSILADDFELSAYS